MLRTILVLGILALIASPAMAQLTVGTGGMFTFISTEGEIHDVGDLFGEVEYQAPLTENGWLGVNLASDGGGLAGLGLRWYYGDEDSALFPGIGLGLYRLTTAHNFVGETTILMGGEAVLEMNIGVGESTLPLTLVVGYYPGIGGDDINMGRFGVKLAPDLFQDPGEE